MRKLKQGLIHVYTGDGKGKTTAALGLAWRAMGRGLKVCIVQFMKSDVITGELLKAEVFGDLLTIIEAPHIPEDQRRKSQPDKAWWMQPPTEAEHTSAQQQLEQARAILTGEKCDLLICDEINVACHVGLIGAEDILALIAAKPENVELVLTGQNAKPEVITKADYVTEMKKLKHPFEQDILARKGIEY